MKIAIHKRENSYSQEWIRYCIEKGIPFKIVDCYQNDIIEQLQDCDALLWHFHHAIPQDILFARQLLYAVQASGKIVFPDFNTMWHFDDKLGQKYLLEAIDAPLAKSYVFYNKLQAIKFIKETSFPKVFKLRVGASSQNVRLIKSKFVALGLAQKAFAKGFNQYSPWINFKETIRKHKLGEQTWLDILKSAARLVYKTDFESFSHKEKGYLYLQEFIPGNKSDTRIVVVDNKAFGARRMVRKNDFRASGSHVADYSIEHIDNKTLKIAFEVANRLKLQCVAFDFVYHENEPYIVEISYGTSIMAYKLCPGYWDTDLNFHTAEFNFCEWIVDSVVEKINTRI